MPFEQLYFQFKHIIFILLNKYRIKYNREEYTQLLTIKMWELTQNYLPHHTYSLGQFLYNRLNYYLIDLFQSQNQKTNILYLTEQIDEQTNNTDITNNHLMYQHFLQQLTEKERQWLILKLSGYKQSELACMLNCSISTVKNYRKKVQKKYYKFYSPK
jgi:RNA polymerase sigma factor (sigma-70 family)